MGKKVEIIVPDTSVIIDRAISKILKKTKKKVKVVVPVAVIDELQAQASKGREIGFIGLDEIKVIREICKKKKFKLEFKGERPSLEDIKLARAGRIDAIIRETAKKVNGTLYTADYVQALVGEAEGVKVKYIAPKIKTKGLIFEKFFTEDTLSVHIKEKSPIFAKRGKPGEFKLVKIVDKKLSKEEVEQIIREISEAARISEEGFVEISKAGATVIQFGQFRIAITRPPFSDGLEVTIVRPVVKLRLEDYNVSKKLIKRLEERAEGILIAGPPGSGKCIEIFMPIINKEGIPKRIDELYNQEVLSLSKRLEPKQIEGRIIEEQNVIEIKTRTGRKIRVSNKHPLLVASYDGIKWKFAGKIKNGDRIAVLRKINVVEREVILPIEKLDGKRTIVEINGKEIPLEKVLRKIKDEKIEVKAYFYGRNGKKSNKIKLPLVLSKELAEIYGYLLAEGSGDTIEFVNSSPILVKRFKYLMKKVFGVNNFYCVEKNRWRIKKGKMIEEFFRKVFGIPKRRKSLTADIPEFMLVAKKEIISRFLRAYFDGDGTIGRSGIEITTGSKKIAEKLSFLLLKLGIFSALKERKIKGRIYYRIVISDRKNIREFYKKVGSTLKKDRFEEFLKGKSYSHFDLIPAGGIVLQIFKLLNLRYDAFSLTKNLYSRKRLERKFKELVEKYLEFLSLEKDFIYVFQLSRIEEIKKELINRLEGKIKNKEKFCRKYHLDHRRIRIWKKRSEKPTLRTLFKFYKGIEMEYGNGKEELKMILGLKSQLEILKFLIKKILRNSREFSKDPKERLFLNYFLRKEDVLGIRKTEKIKKIVKKVFKIFKEKKKKTEELLSHLVLLLNQYLLWDEVIEVKRIGKRKAFDLKIKDSHNFLVGYLPVLVHNSTLASSIAEFYWRKGKIVKTLESPKDLQVPDEITQYGPLEGSFENTADILLLVRPDYSIFDEVRKTKDFKVFADLRLAGVGMVGVVHASKPIDAIQRFMGRIELGMIPHIVDTIIFVEGGEIKKVYELKLVVKVPTGMTEADLARPVVEVRDFESGELEYEIYSYGEENVVVPVKEIGKGKESPVKKLAKERILMEFRKFDPKVEVEVIGDDKAVVRVRNEIIPMIIGKDGKRISKIEKRLGIHIDVEPRIPAFGKEVSYQVRDLGKSLEFSFGAKHAGKIASFYVEGKPIFTAIIGKKGKIKITKSSDIGKELVKALSSKKEIKILV